MTDSHVINDDIRRCPSRKRTRVQIVKITVIGENGHDVEVEAKECTKCNGQPKPLTEFGYSKGGLGSRKSWCISCYRNYRDEKRGGPPTQNKIRWTTETYRDELQKRFGGEYDVIQEYKGSMVKILHKHSICGKNWSVEPSSLTRVNPKRCFHCFAVISHRKGDEKFRYEVKSLVGDEYDVLGDYINNRTKVKIKHNVCGEEWSLPPYSFLGQGVRCPTCRESAGERKIRYFLKSNNVNFEREFRIEACKNTNQLPFDFAVIKNNDLILCLLEFDGIQHHEPVDFSGKGLMIAQKAFELTQRKDRIKTEYCRANGIHLIRIPHWEYDNIETILTAELVKLGAIGNRLTEQNENNLPDRANDSERVAVFATS